MASIRLITAHSFALFALFALAAGGAQAQQVDTTPTAGIKPSLVRLQDNAPKLQPVLTTCQLNPNPACAKASVNGQHPQQRQPTQRPQTNGPRPARHP